MFPDLAALMREDKQGLGLQNSPQGLWRVGTAYLDTGEIPTSLHWSPLLVHVGGTYSAIAAPSTSFASSSSHTECRIKLRQVNFSAFLIQGFLWVCGPGMDYRRPYQETIHYRRPYHILWSGFDQRSRPPGGMYNKELVTETWPCAMVGAGATIRLLSSCLMLEIMFPGQTAGKRRWKYSGREQEQAAAHRIDWSPHQLSLPPALVTSLSCRRSWCLLSWR